MSERLTREDVAGIYALLPMQKGMLYHELLSGDARPYFRQAAFRIEGDFDAARCERAWNTLAERHDALRSSFDYENTSHLLLIVRRTRPVEFHVFDGDAERYLIEDHARGFDLRRDPLTRIALFRLGPTEWEMVWSHPHILLDGWSGSILLSEFASVYAGLELPPAPRYASYVQWLATRDDARSLEYWTSALDGYDTAASVPRCPEREGSGAAEHAFALTADDAAALASLASRNDVTLSTVVQCLWGVLLARYNDTDDVVFGNVVSGRPGELADVERLVGLFINTIPLRIRIGEGQTFASLLRQTQRASLDAGEHDHLSLVAIQELSPLKQALLDHVIAFENYPEADESIDCGFRVMHVRSIEQSHYPFGIIVTPGPRLRVAFQYDRGVHSASQLQRLEGHFRTLAAQVLAKEKEPVAGLEILTDDERARLVTFSRGGVAPVAEHGAIVDLWNAQVARTPDHIALVFGDERFTYREVDERANAIASAISDDMVALHTSRGAFRIIALIGILKSGAACVPISSSVPDERVAFMIEDSGCRTVISPLSPPSGERGHTRPPRPHDLAYVIYTSGSTGKPKGVQIEHGGFVNMIADQIRTFGITPDDRVLQFASCSFDASMSEVFMALLCGATLVVAPDDVIRDGQRFLELIARERVSVVTLPPSYLRALDRAELPLRVLITAGEPPDEHDARHYAARLRYFNAYGPTETSVCATMHEVSPSRPGPIPIGKPVANTRVQILGGAQRVVPIGVSGEIFVAGPGLARGYANSPELTAQKFIVIDGIRWYRTGDRGAWTSDGNILYYGRGDTQVKLRGFRIELSEIEHAARDVAGVRHAVATIHAAQLAVYIAGDAACEDVRTHLARALPPHMVPAFVVRIDEVPRTTAGKIDRAALPPPAASAVRIAPRNDIERIVAEAWREVLHLDDVHVDETFFDAGGDSLKAILLAGRLRRAGYPLDVAELLRLQTIAAIAASVKKAPAIAPIHLPVAARAPLTPIQRWLFDEHARDTLHHLNQSLLLSPARPLESAPLSAALEAVWQHHDSLRLCFPDAHSQTLTNAALPFEIRDAASFRDVERHWASMQEQFDLEKGPLLRAVWYRLPSEEFLLLLAHHLVVDAVSWRFILEDLSDAYTRAAAGIAIDAPPKTTSYLEWAHALDEYSRDPRLLAKASYWRRVDAIDRGRNVVAAHESALEQFMVDAPTLAIVSDAEVQTHLLLAIARMLRTRTRVQLSTHGRESIAPHIDVSRTTGWFTADFPFLLPDCTAAPLAEQLHRLREAQAHVPANGIGYGVLKYLGRDRELTGAPRIAINYLGRLDNVARGFFTPSDRLPSASVGRLERHCAIHVDAALTGSRLSVGVRTSAHDTTTARDLRRELLTILQIEDVPPPRPESQCSLVAVAPTERERR
ncbi:MAG: amino acid adenylation domain-containing protein [Thermoanaerobaculia bacterium]